MTEIATGTHTPGTTLRILRLAGRHGWWLAATVLLSFATLGSGIGLIAMSAYLISRAALVSDTATLALAITGVRFFALCRVVFRYLERYVGHLATFRILTGIRVWFFRSLEPLAPARLADEQGGDLVTRIGADVETLQDFYLRAAVPPVAAGLAVVLATALVGRFDTALGLVLLAYLVLCGAVLPWATRRLGRRPADASVTARARRNAVVSEGLEGLAELVANGAGGRFLSEVASRDRDVRAAQLHLARVRGASVALAGLLAGLAAVTLLGLGAGLVRDGRLDGVLLAVLPLTAIAAFEAVVPLTAAAEHLDRGRAAGRRLFDLVDAAPAVIDPVAPRPTPGDATLELQDLTFRYSPDGPPALADASALIPAGTRVAVVGPSGSGKSTLVSLLLRFEEYRDGHLRLGGTDLRDQRAHDVRTVVTAVMQPDHLFDTTLRDNVLLADADATDDDVLDALGAAGLADVVAALPAGLDERIGENGNRLSGGERQRLMIARALLADTPVLILDEATAHLDPVTERRVLASVHQRRQGRTTITISHHADALDDVDLVLHVDRGHIRVEQRQAVPAAGDRPPARN
jgi:ATP-binding cassette, subfamily C, bacterial CydC